MQLVKYEAARHALKAAASTDEVKDIRDKALALEAYAMQAKDTKMLAWATEIKLRAERKAGEMIRDGEKAKGGQPYQNPTPTQKVGVGNTPTLADLGISYRQSSNWQRLAGIPEDEFEKELVEAKEKTAVLTTSQMVKRVKEKEREIVQKSRKEKKRNITSVLDLQCGDFMELSKNLQDNSIDLILTDPPYQKEYLPLWSDLSKIANRVLKPSGFLITYSGQAHLPEVMNMLSKNLRYYWLGMLLHKGGISQRFEVNMFNRAKPLLFYYKPPLKKQEIWLEDVLVSAQQNKEKHEWGQNKEPFKKLLECFTEPNALVLDPFFGGGSVLEACIETKRNAIGYEIDSWHFETLRKSLDTSAL